MPRHKFPNGNPWSPSDLAFIRENAGLMTLRDIASALNRTYAAVRTMSTRMSLHLRGNYKPWSAIELRKLKSQAGELSASEIAYMLDRTLDSVKGKGKGKGKASLMGISLLCIGELHHASKYSDHDVSLCCALHDEGVSQATIAEKMEIPAHSVHAFIHGKRLTHDDALLRSLLRKER